ncbi:MAG: hypothetical protein ABSH10_01465 [Phycisphaerae bacterium]|jgi:hypothetical protein
MSPWERHRPLILTAVLLAILGASVLAAWSLVWQRHIPADRGEDILRRIRAKTLPSYWGSKESIRWYLIQDASNRPVGYMVIVRKPIGQGYSGATLRRLGGEQQGESWALNAAATKGSYAATLGGRGLPDTQIVLSNGLVTVTRQRAGSQAQATTAAPANYIPEGLRDLVAAEVAKSGTTARFCFTLNPESLLENRVHFTSITMTPHGPDQVRLESHFIQGEIDETCYFDAKGEVYRIDDNISHSSTRQTDLSSLAKWFPEVTEIQRDLEGGTPEPQDTTGTEKPAPA